MTFSFASADRTPLEEAFTYFERGRNVNADLGLPWFCYRTSFDASSLNFRSKKQRFFSKNDFFDISINRPTWPIFMKQSQGKSCIPPFDPNP